VDRGQAQSSTTTGELKAVVIPSIDTFMKRLQQGGLLWWIAVKEGADLSTAAKRGTREIASPKKVLFNINDK
jgi:hypothetical protein